VAKSQGRGKEFERRILQLDRIWGREKETLHIVGKARKGRENEEDPMLPDQGRGGGGRNSAGSWGLPLQDFRCGWTRWWLNVGCGRGGLKGGSVFLVLPTGRGVAEAK